MSKLKKINITCLGFYGLAMLLIMMTVGIKELFTPGDQGFFIFPFLFTIMVGTVIYLTYKTKKDNTLLKISYWINLSSILIGIVIGAYQVIGCILRGRCDLPLQLVWVISFFPSIALVVISTILFTIGYIKLKK